MADALTAISIFVALVTWLVSHRSDIKAQRVAYTANVLSALSTNDRLAESSFQVTKLINGGARVSMRDLDPGIEAHVVDILDYYEFLCDLYIKRVVDRRTILQLRGRLMRRTWNVCETYIRETGDLQNRKVYDGFEQFVRHLPPDDSPAFVAKTPRTLMDRLRPSSRRLTATQAAVEQQPGRAVEGG